MDIDYVGQLTGFCPEDKWPILDIDDYVCPVCNKIVNELIPDDTPDEECWENFNLLKGEEDES